MKAWCPKCGSAARFISQEAKTINFTNAVFRCENPKCGGEVLAEIHFGMRKTPDAHCFSGGATRALTGQASTDC